MIVVFALVFVWIGSWVYWFVMVFCSVGYVVWVCGFGFILLGLNVGLLRC